MEKISKKDQKRILRILEIYHQTGKTKTQLEEESRKEEPKYNYYVYALAMDRKKLYDRIDQRVDLMVEQGLIEEVQELVQEYTTFPTAMQGLGYKEVASFLKGEYNKEEMLEKLKQETRRYAKRQMTWFRRIENITWLPIEEGIEKNKKMVLEEIR